MQRTKRVSTLFYILLQAFQNYYRLFISELINLKYDFSIPFKIILKTMIMGTSQFHDAVQLNILLTLSSEILRLNWVQKKPL